MLGNPFGIFAGLVLCAVTVGGLATSAHAQSATDKLGRGLAGMTTGVLELPGNIKEETDIDGARGIPMGVAKGIGMVVARELIGVYEFISAPLPVPHNYRPILEPEYPWQYFSNT